jgi:hypothetical protein
MNYLKRRFNNTILLEMMNLDVSITYEILQNPAVDSALSKYLSPGIPQYIYAEENESDISGL